MKVTWIVLTTPLEGSEDEYNRWYSDQHLADVLRIPGFISAQRFKAVANFRSGHPKWQYLALYEAETDDPDALLESVRVKVGTPEMPVITALESEVFAVLFEPITKRMPAATDAGRSSRITC
jgi:hypothetical protein